jgi:hypothetical protein
MSSLLSYTPTDNNLSGVLAGSNASVGKLLTITGESSGVLKFTPISDVGVPVRQQPMFLLEGKLYAGGNAVVGDRVRVLFKGIVTGLSYSSMPDVGDYVYRGSGGILSLTPWGSSTIRLGRVLSVDTGRSTYTCWFDSTFAWDTLTGG